MKCIIHVLFCECHLRRASSEANAPDLARGKSYHYHYLDPDLMTLTFDLNLDPNTNDIGPVTTTLGPVTVR